MLPDNINELPPEVLNGILKLLNIDIGEFMQRLINDEPYEIKIYAWIYTRYQENNMHLTTIVHHFLKNNDPKKQKLQMSS